MAKFAPDNTLEGTLERYALADELYVTSAQPANYAGIAAVTLIGPVALTPGFGNGDFTVADGDVSGRKVTVTAQNGVSITTSGTGNHVVLATGGATDLIRGITTFTGQALTSGNTANVNAFAAEVRDPV